MTIDFTQRLQALDGSELVENGKPVTLASVVVTALLAQYPDDHQTTGEAKANRWRLAQQVFAGEGPMQISVEDVVLIKKLVGIGYGPLVVGQAYALLG